MTRFDQRPGARKELAMSTRVLGRRGLFFGAGGLLATGLLTACGQEMAPPPAPPKGAASGTPAPVQTQEQLDRIIPAVHEAVVAADKARDAGKLSPRVSGTAAEFRTSAYKIIKEVDEWAKELEVPGETLVVPMTSVSAEFPRTAIVLVENSVKGGIPFFMALRQDDAASQYTAWGWAQQAAEVEMPDVPNVVTGSEQLTPDAEGLLMTPKQALDLFAAVLTDGDKKDPDDLLAENPFQTTTHQNIQLERKELNAGVEKDEAATIREVFTVDEDDFAGLRTADGGAIVMAAMTSVRKVTIKERASMKYAEENLYTKVVGTTEFKKEFVRTFGTHVAMYIPPEGSDAKIQPIGSTQTVLAITGK